MTGLLLGSLNSGELSPLLDGRVDKEFYQSGAKTLQNMIPLVQGPVMQRSGTGYVKEVKASANRTAMIPFQFNVEQAYSLEFGDQYMRVMKDHAVVLKTGTTITGITKANPAVLTYAGADIFSNGMKVFVQSVAGMVEVNNREFTVANVNVGANTFELSGVNSTAYGTWTSGGTVAEIYEIVTPYLQADLFDADGTLRIKFAQTADVMYLAHPSYPLRKLERTAHTAWTLSTVTLVEGPFAAPNGDETQHVFCTVTGSNYDPGDSISIKSNAAIFAASHVGGLFFMEERYFSDLAVSPWAAGLLTPAVGSQYSNNGNVYKLTVIGAGGAFGQVPPTHIDGEAFDSPIGATNYNKYLYLHSRWVVAEITAFTDTKNVTARLKTYLPNGLAPTAKAISGAANSGGRIQITSNGHGYGVGDYVNITGVVGTVEANGDWRIINVATNTFELEGSVFVNAYGAGADFVTRYATWKWAHGAFSAARGYPGIVAFHEERLALAQSTEEPDTFWLSESASYESFATRSANQILATNSFRGALANGQVNKIEWALSMENGLVLGTAAAEYLLQASQTTDAIGPGNFKAPPVSGHGSRGVQPARAGRTGFFVQKAGKKLREMGYAPDPAGAIGSDMTVRAEHLMKRYPITGMAWVQEPDGLLWCRLSDGTLIAFTFQNEQQVYAWAAHKLGGYSDAAQTLPPIVESVVAIPSPDGSQNELWLIVNRYIDGGTKRFIEYLRPRWTVGDALEDAVMSDSGLTYDGASATVISGLWHLRGQTVAILADGKVHPNKTVDTSGSVTLDYAASVVQLGLPMMARFQSMRLETLTQRGTAQGKRKIINDVALRVIEATNFKYGRDFTTMKRKEFTTQATPLGSALTPFNGDKKVDWPGSWALDAYLCIENDQPVPFGMAALFPNIEAAQT